MGVGCADAVGGVEGDPAETGNEGLRPGMAGILRDDPVAPAEIAADIARGNVEAADTNCNELNEDF